MDPMKEQKAFTPLYIYFIFFASTNDSAKDRSKKIREDRATNSSNRNRSNT